MKQIDKNALVDWEKYKEDVMRSTPVDQSMSHAERERISNAKSLPYFMKDNPQYTGITVDSRAEPSTGQKGFGVHKPTKHGEQFESIPMRIPALDADQISNRNEIAKLAGFTEKEIESMKPMVFEDANRSNVNAQVARNIDTHTNCQGCVVTFLVQVLTHI